MIVNDFLDHIIDRNEQLIRRMEDSVAGKHDAELLRHPHEGVWSPAQVIEHMTLANSYYLPMMGDAIVSAGQGAPAREVRHSFFGKWIIKATGPNGNAPAPPALH